MTTGPLELQQIESQGPGRSEKPQAGEGQNPASSLAAGSPSVPTVSFQAVRGAAGVGVGAHAAGLVSTRPRGLACPLALRQNRLDAYNDPSPERSVSD